MILSIYSLDKRFKLFMRYFYVVLTILFTVYGQIILKWQVTQFGHMPQSISDKVVFFSSMLISPWVISAFISAFLASVAWMAAMTRFQLSQAYPFMSLNFVIVVALSAWLFQEPVSMQRVIGLLFIIIGITIGSQG